MRQNPARFRKSLAIIVTGALALCPLMMLSGAALAFGGQVKGGGIKRKEVTPKKSSTPIARRSTSSKRSNSSKTGAKSTATSNTTSSTLIGGQSTPENQPTSTKPAINTETTPDETVIPGQTTTPRRSSKAQKREESTQEDGPCSRSVSASAHAPQKNKLGSRPATTPQTSDQNTSSRIPREIHLTGMRCSETADGAVIAIVADDALNNYSAYRSGDKYYVVIPDLDAGRGQNVYRNIQMQKRGNDMVFTFRMQPGAKASVRQRFNRLDVVYTLPSDQATPATNAKPPD